MRSTPAGTDRRAGLVAALCGFSILLGSLTSQPARAAGTCEDLLLIEPESYRLVSLSSRVARQQAAIEEALAPNVDPLAFVFDDQVALAVFNHLKYRTDFSGKRTPRPLARINDVLNALPLTKDPVADVKLVEQMLAETAAALSRVTENGSDHLSPEDRTELQSAVYALKLTQEYLSRFIRTKDRGTRPEDEKTPEKEAEKKEEKAKPKKEKKPADKTPPKSPDQYKPHSSEDSGESDPQENWVHAQSTFEHNYWGQVWYNTITRHGDSPWIATDLPQDPVQPGPAKITSNRMTVDTGGRTTLELFVPEGMQPRQPTTANAKIIRLANGRYILTAETAEVVVPLEPVERERLSPPAREHLTRRVGVEESEWPPRIKEVIARYQGKVAGNERAIAEAIEKLIREDYLYSKKGNHNNCNNRPNNKKDRLSLGVFLSSL
jgi:hypothetical protein